VDVHDLPHTAANFELVEGLLQDINPRRKLFLMDTCESGELDDEPSGAAPLDGPGSRGLRSRALRALVLDVRGGGMGQGKRFAGIDRDRYIYNDLSRRSGAIVMSSSRGGEASFELDSLRNGAFTSAILDALATRDATPDKNAIVSVDAMRRYVAGKVAAITNDRQHPTVDRDNLEAKFGFRVLEGAQ
jgi:hypothetical protein